jgi:hypothetical protein
MSRKRIVRLAAVGMVVLMAVAATYLSLLTLCTVRIQGATSNDDAMTFFFPLVPRGELAIAIDKTSRQDVANRYRRGMDDILRAQGVARTVTIVVLLALHVTTFAMLVALFAVVALRVGAKPRGRASPAMAEAEPRAG